LKIDQEQLETVIPALGQKVVVVNGAYRDEEATMVNIDVNNFSVKVKLDTGPQMGTIVDANYEDICKSA